MKLNRIRANLPVLLLGLSAFTPVAHAGGSTAKQPHVVATLLADREAIAPGQTFRLGVQFKLDPDWHIYWPTPGEPDAPAMPTTLELKMPAGFTASRPLFPPPKEHDAGVDGKLYILEGKPVVLFDVQAPATLAAKSVTLEVNAGWLVCEKSCIRGDAELSLTLPVATDAAASKPANAEVFKSAAAALPVPAAQAKYLRIGGATSPSSIKPGDKFEVVITLDVEAAHHIQSSKPRDKSLVATRLFIEPGEGLELGKPKYPPGKTREIEGLGKVSEYSGRVEIRVPVEATEDFKKSVVLHGVLSYQACDDKGTCFPPIRAAFEMAVQRDGAPPASTSPVAVAAIPDDPATGSADGAAPAAAATERQHWLERVQRWFERGGVLGYLGLAVIGGFLLNFMPCVLPVISLKVLSFVKQAQESRFRVAMLGLTFAAGIIASYLVLAWLAFAAEKTWGGLFQYPQVIIGLAAVVTAFSLSLFGVFTLSPPAAVDQLGAKVAGEGLGSAFGMGILATLLGTACTAPFLSFVIAIAVKQTATVGVLIFAAAGFGMAFPYILLTLNPAWLRFVPRAGPWMKTFEQVMGFVLLGTVLWVIYPLPNQITGKGLIWALCFVLAVSFAAWLYGRVEFGAEPGKRIRYYGGALLVIVLGWYLPFRQFNTIESLQAEAVALRMGNTAVVENWDKEIPWRPYRRADAMSMVAAGHTVFIDYTADWCASCKANEASSLNIDSTRQLMAELKVVPYKADYTSETPEIKADLKRLGRAGVPVYVVYSPGDAERPNILPELLTPSIVHDALRQAGPSRASRLARASP